MFRVSADIGGTFTDIVVEDASNKNIKTIKVLTTPENPANAVFEGLNIFALIWQDLYEPSKFNKSLYNSGLLSLKVPHTVLSFSAFNKSTLPISTSSLSLLPSAILSPI